MWFKELFMLIGMLFSKVDRTRDINVIITKHFPFEGYAYMMWCGCIVTRKTTDISEESYNHEKGHLIQASFYKWWIQYYAVYLWEWIKGNPIINPASSAYYTIPFEIQAYANQHDSNYDYNRDDLKNKYTLKNRKKLYKSYRFEWKYFVKTL